jgi:phage-related protein
MLDDIYQVSFNGNRIDLVPGVDLYNHNFTSLPTRDIKIHKLARRSLSIITSSEYSQKSIPVFLDVCSGTKQQTEATITFIKGLLQGQNGQLKVLQSGLEVNYTSTMNEFNIEWNANHAYCTIVFLASDPVGNATQSVTAVNKTGITSSSDSTTFVVQGSFDAEPVITVNVSAVTGGTGGTINLTNAVTQQGITITTNYSDGDILIVNSKELTVTLNGINLDFVGLFPLFPAGVQQFSYSDTFTTRTVDIFASYTPRLI